MSRATVEFVLQNADGEDVNYSVTPHPGSEALGIVFRIVHVAAKPLGRLLEGNLGRLLEAVSSSQDVEISDLIDELDLQLGDALGDVFTILQDADPAVLTRELLAHTYREGRSLKQTKNFDDAYTANYGEMLEACVKSVKVNRFLGLFRTSIGSLIQVQEKVPDTTNSPERNELSA